MGHFPDFICRMKPTAYAKKVMLRVLTSSWDGRPRPTLLLPKPPTYQENAKNRRPLVVNSWTHLLLRPALRTNPSKSKECYKPQLDRPPPWAASHQGGPPRSSY